ncbi:MAG: UDP-2,3-diacylglucosamine diphosphatase LpxI [Candidatus Omnitrophica bacterium]|nr:UDP-2,3-diacylglucosamine diphosphatase LpxI [Candidatus Omnitrophota bacterium]MBU1871856.1 UDP-2,3-diacylglucosamine diphosphatase LpxI [Candidatus Omnitrophota bacterium]
MPRIGLIAGNRKFPLIFAQEAKRKGYSVVAVAIKGETHPGLGRLVEKIYWLDLGEFSRLFEVFSNENITEAVLAGQISPWQLFRPQVKNNPELKSLLNSLRDKRADTIFREIARRLEAKGIKLLDSTFLLSDYMPEQGVLTKQKPAAGNLADINLGLEIAKEIGGLDIGQTVAIKNKAIVAIEALEGTDNLIRRAGRIARAGVIIIKVSKPAQDMRFDVPVVGLNTVKSLLRAKAAGLAIEANKTLFIDKEQSLKLADRKGIFITAV